MEKRGEVGGKRGGWKSKVLVFEKNWRNGEKEAKWVGGFGGLGRKR